MPIKSKAQYRLLRSMVGRGTLSKAKFREMQRGTPKNLPEYVGKRPKRKKFCAEKYKGGAKRGHCKRWAWRGGKPSRSVRKPATSRTGGRGGRGSLRSMQRGGKTFKNVTLYKTRPKGYGWMVKCSGRLVSYVKRKGFAKDFRKSLAESGRKNCRVLKAAGGTARPKSSSSRSRSKSENEARWLTVAKSTTAIRGRGHNEPIDAWVGRVRRHYKNRLPKHLLR